MTMKILNRFIDDCVNVFQYRFMDTFQYFKERNKNKYLGDRFEEWVVKILISVKMDVPTWIQENILAASGLAR